MHIHITFMTYHLYMLIACKSLSVHVLCLWHIFYLYFYCILVYILYIFLYFSSFLFMTYRIPCTITYIFSYTVYISCLISCNGYTPMLYFSFFIFILVLSYIFILYAFILNFFIYCHLILFIYFIYICTFLFYHILYAFVYFLYFSCIGLSQYFHITSLFFILHEFLSHLSYLS